LTFYSHNKNHELDKLGCFSHTRWRHIHKIHCVFPNGTGQILGAKSLDAAHYQSFYANFLEAIQGYDGEIEAIVHLPNANKTTNDFLLLMNQFSPDERERLLESIPFEALGLLVYNEAMKEEEQQLLLVPKHSVLKHQIFYIDFGFTGGHQCTSRKGHDDGISAPVPKPGTYHPLVKQTFEALTKVLQHVDFPFCKNPHVDKKHSKRNSEFAAMISQQN
jgi:hypothetical protein